MLSSFSPTNAFKNANVLSHHYHENNHGSALNIANLCDCNTPIARTLAEVQNLSVIEFETVLRVGLDVTKQCEAMVACEYCQTHRHNLISLQSVLEHILIFYEAACSAYALGPIHPQNDEHGSAFMQSSPIPSPSQRLQLATAVAGATTDNGISGDSGFIVCRTSKMTWGDMELHGEDAELLARVLLRQRLTSLGALLREICGGVWNRNWAQQEEALRACETSLTSSMDKLMTLLGRIR